MIGDERLICALDFPTFEEARAAVAECGEEVTYYKVGMELYYAAGNDIIRFLKDQKKKIFLDLKLEDIPNTVSSALKVLTALGCDMMNVHAVGGRKMMTEAAKAVKEKAEELGIKPPKLIAVTILTSMDEEQFKELNYAGSIADEVVRLALLAKDCGLDGVVASPKEAALIRKAAGPDFLIVTPGVRPKGSDAGDQKRITEPRDAIAAGASHMVVGRPVMRAKDRAAAARAITDEIEGL